MASKFAVIGLGQFGRSIALALAGRGAEVIAIDRDMSLVESVKEDVALAVALDATDEKALKSQNISEVDAAVVAIGEDFEARLLASVILLELKVKRIISRATSEKQKMILERIGVKEILSPEETVGKNVAETLIHPQLKNFFQLPDDFEIAEIKVPKRLIGKTLAEARITEKFDLNLITIKRDFPVEQEEKPAKESKKSEHIIKIPKSNMEFKEGDIMILMGKNDDMDRFLELGE